ncbi:hypothetical protein CK203_043086 [Vitis vinifera]|uniref:Uncharacterized protein n=1 Tax=Vitis vinifera TaxID=29760 RepID=A0A438GXD0_VITVI|nr:hypothetical protein CK203_043086 [Vitis vinifera]
MLISRCSLKIEVEGGYWEASIRSNQPARSRESRDPFFENEIQSALMEMNGDKALDRMVLLWRFGKAIGICESGDFGDV